MRVAVALSTYDGAAHLPEQLASLTAQTRLPDLLAVRDDGSTDGTRGLLDEFAAGAPFAVRVLPPGPRLGSTRSFEVVLDTVRADVDVVLLCDQDDLWRSDKVARLLGALEPEPAALLAYSDARLVDADGAPLGWTAWESVGLDDERRAVLAGDGALDLLLARSLLTGMTMAVRTPLLDLALPFPAEVRDARAPELLHDRWLTLVAAATGPLVGVPEPLADYRRHGAQQMGLHAPAQEDGGSRASLPARVARLRTPALGDRVTAELRGDAVRAAVLRDHLAARGVDTAAVRRLRRHAQHLEAVLSLPRGPVRRVGPVLRELRTGGYAGRGRKAALDDVLRRTSDLPGADHAVPDHAADDGRRAPGASGAA